MRFVGRQPKEGINVSDTHPLVEAGTLVVGLTAIFIAIALALVFIVEVVLYFVPPEKEAKFFADWLPDDLITVSHTDERLLATQELVDVLASEWPDSSYSFRVEIDDSETANAMALPGGLIIVTTGLLDTVESENELAFVLGHELGHFKNRDHIRALGRGVVLSMFFAVITGNDVAGIGIKVTDLTLRGFSRKQESRADEFGLSVVHAYYGHVNQAWRLFERWDEELGSARGLVAYVSTHPLSADRIDQMRRTAAERGWEDDGEIRSLAW